VALTRELRKRLDDLADYAEGDDQEFRLHPLAALAIEDFTEQLPHLDADHGWKTRLAKIREAKAALEAAAKENVDQDSSQQMLEWFYQHSRPV
jgi:hypothetical protein